MQQMIRLTLIVVLSVFLGSGNALAGMPVRVGVFENKPVSFTDDTGSITGIYPDLLQEIAEAKGWDLEFIRDSWAGSLTALETGGIDLMISIVPTPERQTRYSFTTVPVVTLWGQVYTRGNNAEIASILDLEGRTVGIMDKDVNGQHLQRLAEQFRITVDFRPFPVYGDLCKALAEGAIDAAVMNNINGAHFSRTYNLSPSPILFNPVDAYFAVRKGSHPQLIEEIDQLLATWKSDKTSVYYTILNRWYGNLEGYAPPGWVFTAAAVSLGLVGFLFVWIRILRIQIRRHTKRLQQSAEKYKALSDRALVGIFQVSQDGRVAMANQRMDQIMGFKDKGLAASKADIRRLLADLEHFEAMARELDAAGAMEGRLVEFITRDNHSVWGNLYIRKTQDEAGRPLYEGFLEDVSHRYRHEQLLQTRLRLSQMSGACSNHELLQAFLDSAEQMTGSCIGFFHFLSRDQQTIELQTWSTQTLATMCKTTARDAHYPVDQAGVWADCIKAMAPVIHNDYAALPHKKGMPEGHVPVIRELVVPVIRNNRIQAILGVGNKKTDYTDTDLDVVRELADTAWDIVLKNQVENELMASEARYRQFIETAVEGIWVLDQGFNTTFVNATMARELGYPPGEFLGKPFEDFLFDQDLADYQAKKEICRQGTPQQFEGRFQRKDGSEFWAIVSASPIQNPDKGFDGVFAMLTNITDRRQMEKELELTRQRFLAILDGIDSTIYVSDIQTHEILFMNQYMKTLFGGDFTGDLCYKAFRCQNAPCSHCTNRFLLDDHGVPTGFHLSEDKHPATGRWNIYHDTAIKWVDGRMARLQIATDITKLKEMELRQREYETKIRQAQKMEALGALAGGIAHDFNNILFPILGYSELLMEDSSDPKRYKKGLAEIMNGARRARDLVEQILTFSRQTDRKVVPLRPDLVIKEVIKLVRVTLPATIRIEKFIQPGVHQILADPTQIHQVAMNLVTNAFHAMEAGGGVMTICLENHTQADDGRPGAREMVHFSVKDTGTGMDKDTQAKIFDPYYTTKPDGKGTGLGLSVVHGIVKKYKGEIRVTSSPGEGSCFDLFFPAADRMADDQGYTPQTDDPGGTERLLLVDDDPQVLLLEKAMLGRLGYAVTTENQSPAALERIQKEPDGFDLVITDMTMPKLSGDLLTEAIREHAPHLPVLICTGFSERLSKERVKELGVRGVLLKPVGKSDLARAVRDALDQPG